MRNSSYIFLALTSLAIVFSAPLAASAQSGRRSKPAAPAVSVQQPTSSPAPRKGISEISLIIAGEIATDAAYFRSNVLGPALEECVESMRKGGIMQVTKAGKLSRREAVELAKKETAHILWISFVSKIDGLGNMRIDRAEYYLLIPRTAAVLTSGQIEPGLTNVMIGRGGVLNIPRQRTSSASMLREMRILAREVAATLLQGGWLKN